ncbi:PLP-dependent aminotransferase family protein [Actinomadura sp. BRA 177]|uniref:aminotransferase-like domain-containing protein n=1 Tax=Actinomadura sp. BRA 177 TaxID=2745202 RepID=UPI0015961E5B|nr:PLP-dependent aminotransferase family protein [Actinomadura sp. BRA 177]NVI86090.1 PLP-dependent aminotransferase family protein [Actinomadura sp. BRA 177]
MAPPPFSMYSPKSPDGDGPDVAPVFGAGPGDDPGYLASLRTATELGRLRAMMLVLLAAPVLILVIMPLIVQDGREDAPPWLYAPLAAAALLALLRAGGHRELAVEDPTSVRQLPMMETAGLRLVRVPVDEEGLDVAALAAGGARTVLVTPAHQYPTGVVLSAARRAALIAWARDVDGLILEDDYDAEFRYDRDPVGCLQGVDPDRVVLLGSVSKSLAPALRLGWAVAPPSTAARLRDHRAVTDLGAPILEQHALTEFLRGGGYDRHLRTMRRRYRARRDALAAALDAHLPDARVHGVSAGIHLYVELPPGCDEDETVARAARAGVAVTGARSLWSAERAAAAPPALVLGYAGLSETRLVKAAELLGQAVTHGADG